MVHLVIYDSESDENPKRAIRIESLLCAAVVIASHQHGLEACTVYGDPRVCSCRYSKSSAGIRSIYCVWRPYCLQLEAQQVISMG
jgi:hypothetical protein